jgi:protein-tyrosine phosphatase
LITGAVQPRGIQPRESRPRPWRLALLWLAGLTLLFFVSYAFTNWITGLRTNVPELAFGWERGIPFLAWTIVPYWSTDLFYAASLLLCRTRAELHTLGRRLIAVQALCCAGFVLVPLRFGFERPHPDELFGRMFDALSSFDRPFNQAPSLHIALTAVLWAAYERHFTGWARWLIRGWFSLTALSTLTTFQHHFIDLPTGLWVGLFCIALFPDRACRSGFPVSLRPSRDPRRFLLAAVYLTGAMGCGFLAWRIGELAWILLWPAAALTLVAAIYCTGRPELFGKTEGIMPPAVIGVLAPYLAGAWLNSRWHTHGQASMQEISGGVWLGRIPRRGELARSCMASVVDLTAELPFTGQGVVYRVVPMLDLLTPAPDRLNAAVNAIQALHTSRPTLVCCALGYTRSATAVAAWLIASGQAPSASEAVAFIRARRPSIVVPPSYLALLECWAGTRTNAAVPAAGRQPAAL